MRGAASADQCILLFHYRLLFPGKAITRQLQMFKKRLRFLWDFFHIPQYVSAPAKTRENWRKPLPEQKSSGGPQGPPERSSSKTCVERNPLQLGRGSSRGRQPASSGIECPECLVWQGVQRAQRGLFLRAAAEKYRHFCRLSEKPLGFFDSLCSGGPQGPPERKGRVQGQTF